MDTVEARARTKVSDDECATGLRFKKILFTVPRTQLRDRKLQSLGKDLVEAGLNWLFCRIVASTKRVLILRIVVKRYIFSL